MIVGQGPVVLAVDADGGCLDNFTLLYLFSYLSPSLWETARYRLIYCLKVPFNPKQPTNQSFELNCSLTERVSDKDFPAISLKSLSRSAIYIRPSVTRTRLTRLLRLFQTRY